MVDDEIVDMDSGTLCDEKEDAVTNGPFVTKEGLAPCVVFVWVGPFVANVVAGAFVTGVILIVDVRRIESVTFCTGFSVTLIVVVLRWPVG